MYTPQQSKIVTSMGNWLAKTKWDIFSTITYRYDVKAKQNFKIMTGLEEYLKTLKKPFNMFWVTEYTNYNYNTHNHLLLKGDIVGDINYHLKSKSLIGDHVKHLPYEKGAAMYVSKFICDEKTNYGFVKK
tara:strand:- start:51 stop:440 length:390 start_codon:yes stop_codon:yes gene_type:complete